MRTQDKVHFISAASRRFWILVRRTNKASLDYIGLKGYVPKRIDCKAKTASENIGKYKLAGLVVDPGIHSSVFDKPLSKVIECWSEIEHLLGKEYNVEKDKSSKHYGCLKLNGSYLHGDYDLKAIIDIKQANRNLALVDFLYGVPHNVGPNFYFVRDHVNKRIGTPMIQHGAEESYAGHGEEIVDAFGPKGENFPIENKLEMQKWYDDIKRKTLVEERW
jgi:hypothetical protein